MGIALTGLFSCSDSGAGGFGGQIGINQDAGSGDKKPEPIDDEGAPADEPTQITGAFLSLAFEETQDATSKSIRERPDGDVQIAACLRDKKTLQCIDTTGLSFRWELVSVEKRYLPIRSVAAPQTYDFSFLLSIPIQHLAGTVLVKIDDVATSKDGLRARTLTSVGEFGAKYGRKTASAAQTEGYDPREEASELGLPIPPGQQLGQEAQAIAVEDAATAPTPVAKDRDDEAGFWEKTLGIIKDVFGDMFGVAVTNITTEPVVSCTTCGEDMQFVVPPPQARPQAASISGEATGRADQAAGGSGGWTAGSPGGSGGDGAAAGGSGWQDGTFQKDPASSTSGSGADYEAVVDPLAGTTSDESGGGGGTGSSDGDVVDPGQTVAGSQDGQSSSGSQGNGSDGSGGAGGSGG